MTKRKAARALLAAAGLLAAATLAAAAAAPASAATGSLSPAERNLIRSATQHLRTPADAIAAGYVPTDECTALPGVGGMGYHYVNLQNVLDGVVDAERPDVLVFVDGPDGRRHLGAAEYMQVDGDQDVTTDGDRPSLFDHPFDGPMLGHEPGMPIHYDLHVWLYEHNPAGQLQPWNPRVDCSAA
jgi:hypothetical protein